MAVNHRESRVQVVSNLPELFCCPCWLRRQTAAGGFRVPKQGAHSCAVLVQREARQLLRLTEHAKTVFTDCAFVLAARCSQPLTGLTHKASLEDEQLVQAIRLSSRPAEAQAASSSAEAKDDAKQPAVNGHSTTPTTTVAKPNAAASYPAATPTPPPTPASAGASSAEDEIEVVIVDARSELAASGNALKGAGSEQLSDYKHCRVFFASIANIHAMRKVCC